MKLNQLLVSLSLVGLSLLPAVAQNKTKTTPQQPAQKSESPIQHLTSHCVIEHIWDYKDASPNKFTFKGPRPAIVDFWATWCGPCKALAPKLEKIAEKYKGQIDVYKIDIDKEPEMAKLFGIRSIPTLLFIPMEGTPIQTVGDLSLDQLEASVAEILK